MESRPLKAVCLRNWYLCPPSPVMRRMYAVAKGSHWVEMDTIFSVEAVGEGTVLNTTGFQPCRVTSQYI